MVMIILWFNNNDVTICNNTIILYLSCAITTLCYDNYSQYTLYVLLFGK